MTLTNTQYAEVISNVGGYYNFVSIVQRRIKELRNGQGPMIEPHADEDEIDLVVREIEAGLLQVATAESSS